MDVLLYALLTGLFTIYWIILLVDCIRLKALTRKTRIIWIIVIVLGGPPIGALIYHGARSSLLKAAEFDPAEKQRDQETRNGAGSLPLGQDGTSHDQN